MSAVKSEAGSKRFTAIFVTTAMLLPTAVAWLYFVMFDGQDAVRWIYSLGKVAQFALPVLWWLWWARRQADEELASDRLKPAIPKQRRESLVIGLAFGAVVALGILALYFGGLRSGIYLTTAAGQIQRKLAEAGLHSPGAYLGLALFLSGVHSLLEEYYWRWFVFGRLQTMIPWQSALVLSGLAFMAHHVVVLGVFFGAYWGATLFFSLCIAVGGGIWAWLLRRCGSLTGPWVSHLLVDAALMLVGYDLVWGLF